MAIFELLSHKILKKDRKGGDAVGEKPDLYRIAVRLLGIFFGHISLLGGVASFGLSFLTIERTPSLYAVLNYALGVLGSIWLLGDMSAVKYALAGGIYLLFLFARNGDKPLRLLDSAFVISVSLIVSGCLFILWDGFEISSLVMLLCECFACLSATVVFDIVKGAAEDGRFDPRQMSLEEKICFLAAGALSILSLRKINVFGGFSPANAAACLIILSVASSAGAGYATAVAAFLGGLCGVGSGDMPFILGSLCAFALTAGVLRRHGRILSAAGAALVCAAIGSADGDMLGAPLSVIEAAAAGVLQFLIPARVYTVISDMFTPPPPPKVHTDDRTKKRLYEAARSIKELAETLIRPQSGAPSDITDASEIFDGAADIVCRKCVRCSLCWQDNYSATYTAMCRFFGVLESRGEVTPSDAPDGFAETCLHLRPFVRELNRLYEIGRNDRVWRKRMNENRALAGEQLGFVSEILEKLALEADMSSETDLRLENELALRLRLVGIRTRSVHITRTPSGRLSADIFAVCRRDARGLCKRTVGVSCLILPHGMRVTEIKREDKKTVRISMYEEEALTARVGCSARGAEEVNGDKYAVSSLPDGKIAVTVSDGMGVGKRASEDSEAIVKLLSGFLQAGFDKRLAVRLVNSIMVMRSAREAFATVDMCVIDLYSGEVEFMKTGAEPSYIKRSGQVETVRAASLPVGMFPSVEPECFARRVKAGDCIVMTTDGAATKTGGGAWLKEYLETADCSSSKKLASDLLSRAVAENGGKLDDDITIIAIEISARKSKDKF